MQEATPVGQKTVRFSDLSGELITRDDTLARIVIHEHPELGDTPVEIEALADEAAAIEKAALRVAVVELYLPGEDEPRRVAMDAAAFDEMAADKPMSELLLTARPARAARRAKAAAAPRHQLRHPGARRRAAQGPDHRSRARAGPGPSGRHQRAARRPGPADHRPGRPGARRAVRPGRPGRGAGRPGGLAHPGRQERARAPGSRPLRQGVADGGNAPARLTSSHMLDVV